MIVMILRSCLFPAVSALLAVIVFVLGAMQALADDTRLDEPITPVPLTLDTDPQKVELGRLLFNDSRLSGGNGVSCASCHFLNRGMADGLALSRGLPGHPGITNSLSLFNVGLSSKLTWAGLDLTLAMQTERVIHAPSTMGADWDAVTADLRNDRALSARFAAAYRDGLQTVSVIDALVEFQRSLITPNAPFDRYLRGEDGAIDAGAKQGYRLFKDYGCVSCHQGVNVGGNMLQVFGIFGKPPAAARGAATPGSAQNSGIAEDLPVFRVPVLRNVQFTAPYFHDGSVATLPEAIAAMARYQLGREAPDADIAAIQAFLNSLSGEYQGIPLKDL